MSELLDKIGLANITEEQLQALVTFKVEEGLRLDYKRELTLPSPAAKKEFCKDVSAFYRCEACVAEHGWVVSSATSTPMPRESR